jgi:hypothetical protein
MEREGEGEVTPKTPRALKRTHAASSAFFLAISSSIVVAGLFFSISVPHSDANASCDWISFRMRCRCCTSAAIASYVGRFPFAAAIGDSSLNTLPPITLSDFKRESHTQLTQCEHSKETREHSRFLYCFRCSLQGVIGISHWNINRTAACTHWGTRMGVAVRVGGGKAHYRE